ncbi:hypothetical protein HMPREF1146_0868 [Prevotella sp. MSX73]|nr:hypothetical protein HMPREF1146_0868 [Prevotella sp. MSX73]
MRTKVLKKNKQDNTKCQKRQKSKSIVKYQSLVMFLHSFLTHFNHQTVGPVEYFFNFATDSTLKNRFI